MFGAMGQSAVKNLGNGGTMDGDLTISGDLTVSGGGSLSFDEILEGTQVIDVTNTEAFLVRKNSDGGDVFIIDTTNSRVGIGGTPTAAKLEVHGGAYNTSLLIKGSGADTGIKFVDSGGTTDGYIYATGGDIGFLDDDAEWAVKVDTDTSTSLLVNN